MRKIFSAFAIGVCFLLSGCTVAQFTYLRNLTEHTAEVYFDFDPATMKSIPDSISIPFSATSHPVNRKTYTFMTDSIVARRYTGMTLRISIPAGGMIMIDKNTSHKIGYHYPDKMKVAIPGKEPYTVRLSGDLQAGERQFQTKGNSPKLYWHDIY